MGRFNVVNTPTTGATITAADTLENLQEFSYGLSDMGIYYPLRAPVSKSLSALTGTIVPAGIFSDGTSLYTVPGSASSIVAKLNIADFTTAESLDLSSTDADYVTFSGGFTDGIYAYFVPNNTSGKFVRVLLSDFSTVDDLDLTTVDADYHSFYYGILIGRTAYLISSIAGDIVTVDLDTWAAGGVSALTATIGEPSGSSIATDGKNLFLNSGMATTYMVDIANDTVYSITTGTGAYGLQTDGKYAYWLDSNPTLGLYRAKARDFSTAEVLPATIAYTANSALLVGNYMYIWDDTASPDTKLNRINVSAWSVTAPVIESITAATGAVTAGGSTVVGDYLYFACTDETIRRVYIGR